MMTDNAIHRYPVISRGGFLVLCLMLVTALLLTTSPVMAQTTINPDAVNTIEIHKFEQPVGAMSAADGLRRDTSGLTPVPGATFTAKRVPGIDLSTNSGQRAAARITPADAIAGVADEPVAATATTDSQGDASLSNLPDGLYLVTETIVPAGYAGAVPFLVALPLTHPDSQASWLPTVHVYPKNAKAGINLGVIDQHAVKIGDSVRWISKSGIPTLARLDGYKVEQVINPRLSFDGYRAGVGQTDPGDAEGDVTGVDIVVTGQVAPLLRSGVDYRLSYRASTRTLSVDFHESGLRKLEQAVAADPSAQIQVEYETTVLEEGVHTNEAVLYPSRDAIERKSAVRDIAVTKWGPLSVKVFENNNPDNLIPDVPFELYLTPEDAVARRNPVTVDGVREWRTDQDGRLVIHGLRFSQFANGLDREHSDETFRDYWVAPTTTPEGWHWMADEPLNGSVYSDVEYQTLEFMVEQNSSSGPPDRPEDPKRGLIFGFIPIPWGFGGSSDGGISPNTPVAPDVDPSDPSAAPGQAPIRDALATTGAQVIGVVIFGVVFIIAGIFLIMRRRQRADS